MYLQSQELRAVVVFFFLIASYFVMSFVLLCAHHFVNADPFVPLDLFPPQTIFMWCLLSLLYTQWSLLEYTLCDLYVAIMNVFVICKVIIR